MSDWTDRIPVEAAARMLRDAVAADFMSDERAVIFHDLGRMRRRLACLRVAFPGNAVHTLAIKANPLVEVLRVAVAEGAGLEAASFEEIELARAAKCPAGRILFDSPAKTVAELESALRWGIRVNADSFAELERIAAIFGREQSQSMIGLRINTQVGAGSIASTSVANVTSKFGVPLSQRSEILDAFKQFDWLRGIHAHVGSQGCDSQMLITSAKRLLALRKDIHFHLGHTGVTTINIGGGLPVAYRSEDRPISVEDYASRLQSEAAELFDPSTRLFTEFGRSIQAGCGVAFSRVEYVKDPSVAVIHFGADLFLRWVYNPADWNHEMFVLDRHGQPKLSELRPTTVAGPLCFGGDILGHDVMLPNVDPGDWIGIRDVGAYTLSMWSHHCNRRIPLVLGHDAKSEPAVFLLRERETAVDTVDLWSKSR